MRKILVTGGCGYIGSHTIIDLIENGFEPISVDNLYNSSEDSMSKVEAITGKRIFNYAVDLCDAEATHDIFRENPDIIGVIHFAALKSVGESVHHPIRYFRNNLNSLLNVVDAMTLYDVKHLIFSSSCSVYGNSSDLPVTEETPHSEAESPYARTKQMGEMILRDFCRKHNDKNSILLRYFNPAGAHSSGIIGEAPTTVASNLVPVIVETAIGKRAEVVVFGDDYDTRDGSCVRDYIHIMDLANAHTKALHYLIAGRNRSNCEAFNLGIGEGITVLEAIRAFEKATGQFLNYRIGERRKGDIAAIYSNHDRATKLLGWNPSRGIEEIMQSAWEWEKVKSKMISSIAVH